MKNVTFISGFLVSILPGFFFAQTRDMAKSIRISNYTTYISDNTISSKGLSNTVELYNYRFSNSTSVSVLSLGTENKYTSAQNSFSCYFKKNVRLKNSLVYVNGTTVVNETVKMFWNPREKMWTPTPIMSKFPPKDTLITDTVSDKFFVAGFGIQGYQKAVNIGIEGFFVSKSGHRPDNNLQLSLVADIFKQRKISGFVHADVIQNKNFPKNQGPLYFTEGEISVKVRPFTFSINGGYGKSIFRYALLDNGYLEYSPVLLKYTYGIKTVLSFPSWGGIFFNVSQNSFHPPNNASAFTSYYGGIKVFLKKY